jgi:hypothetical protein
MGLFGDRKERKREQKEQIADVMGEVGRNVELGQKLAAKRMGAAGMDVSSLMAAANAAMAPGAMQGAQAASMRMIALTTNGVECPATLRAFTPGAPSPMGAAPTRLDLTVEPAGGAPYDVSVEQVFAESMLQGFAPGQRVTVKVDPADPQSVMLWGVAAAPGAAPAAPAGAAAAAAAPAPASTGDRIERLEKLQALRQSGVLTEEEFQEQKARLLAAD